VGKRGEQVRMGQEEGPQCPTDVINTGKKRSKKKSEIQKTEPTSLGFGRGGGAKKR